MKKESYIIMNTKGEIMAWQPSVYIEDITHHVNNFRDMGFRIVEKSFYTKVNVITMEPISEDDKRKTKIVNLVNQLSDRDRALLLAYLVKRNRKVDAVLIWNRPKLRIIHNEISNIRIEADDFIQMLIVTLRQKQ